MDGTDVNLLCDFFLKVINIRHVGQMKDYTSERLKHGEATSRLEAIHPVRVKVFTISVTMVMRGEQVSTRYFLQCLRHFRMNSV